MPSLNEILSIILQCITFAYDTFIDLMGGIAGEYLSFFLYVFIFFLICRFFVFPIIGGRFSADTVNAYRQLSRSDQVNSQRTIGFNSDLELKNNSSMFDRWYS